MRAYISGTSAISPQSTFEQEQYLQQLQVPEQAYLAALEPEYRQYIDPKLSRRMARIIKMSIAAAKKSLEQAGAATEAGGTAEAMPGAIIVGTALGCLQDTEKFLAEIVETREGLLSPTAFIQSTHNTIAGQIALLLGCPHHNFTFVQRGFSFERALEDALLQIGEGVPQVLLGGVDEVTPTLFQILQQLGCAEGAVGRYPHLQTSEQQPAWGEGATFFALTREPSANALACIEGMHTFYGAATAREVQEQIAAFLQHCGMDTGAVDALMMGFTGNRQEDEIYSQIAESYFPDKPLLGFKNLCGEYFTASAFGLHLAAIMLQRQQAFSGTLLSGELKSPFNNILLYNRSQGKYHSLMLLSS
ncbi:beta-ketoacyl synthase chain length factor [Cesiribacter sp. SM1]|uniref:beta-ketoacyl synthase chain length factor n=1 Tax=Cesiribacter sp. SM1 TaxID=2861196 RepID=UPI001CD1A1A1|nr:beta-ketoacyl synthase chain length factor [Cesiribacter sp. SM1]